MKAILALRSCGRGPRLFGSAALNFKKLGYKYRLILNVLLKCDITSKYIGVHYFLQENDKNLEILLRKYQTGCFTTVRNVYILFHFKTLSYDCNRLLPCPF